MIKNAFSVLGAYKPEHLIYDSNCAAKQKAMANDDAFFATIGMCVNIWHFLNKHKISHSFCQQHCNSAMYPKLMDKHGKWFFNTSVAEQTNTWLRGYHSICHKMLLAKFDFFFLMK